MRARAYSSAIGSARSFQQRLRTRARIRLLGHAELQGASSAPPAACPAHHSDSFESSASVDFAELTFEDEGGTFESDEEASGRIEKLEEEVTAAEGGAEEEVSAAVQARHAAGNRGLSRPSTAMKTVSISSIGSGGWLVLEKELLGGVVEVAARTPLFVVVQDRARATVPPLPAPEQ
jgi:hypothetical protein